MVQEACSRLPSKLKTAFLLRTQEEMSFEEIGQVLGVTEETVRWRVFKARHELLNELKNYLDGKSG
jgi:RNA polymerase sigma-70 factor (ECF subfamily)